MLSLPYNLGVGGAMRAGFRYAERAGYRVVVQVDADGQHDPAAIQSLVDALDGAGRCRRGRRGALRRRGRVQGRQGTPGGDAAARPDALAHHQDQADRRDLRAFAPPARARCRSSPAATRPSTSATRIESLVIAARSGCVCRQVPVVMRPRYAGTPSQSAWKSIAYLGRAFLVLMLAAVRRWPQLSPEADDQTPAQP